MNSEGVHVFSCQSVTHPCTCMLASVPVNLQWELTETELTMN